MRKLLGGLILHLKDVCGICGAKSGHFPSCPFY
jgi:hypothetical protein